MKALGLGALLIASVVLSLSACFATRGGSTEEATVKSFLTAVQANDRRGLAALIHPDYAGEKESAAFLERYGGGQLASVQIVVEPNSIASYMATARVTASFTPAAGGSARAVVPTASQASRVPLVRTAGRAAGRTQGSGTNNNPEALTLRHVKTP